MLKRIATAIRPIDALAVALILFAPACGSDGPTNSSRIPNVAGTYSGPLTFAVDGVVVATVSMRINVVQSGSQLTVTGSMTLEGETQELGTITGIVDETGLFTVTSGGDSSPFHDPDCGTITGRSVLTFSDNTARYVVQGTTSLCGNWLLSGTLRR